MEPLLLILIVLFMAVIAFAGVALGYFLGRKSADESHVPALESGLDSLSDAINRMNAQVQSNQQAGVESATALRSELMVGLQNHNQMLTRSVAEVRQQAQQLTSVLSRSGARGQWGEMELRRLVEATGLLNRVHFLEQSHFATEDGALRPDLQVMLSDDRCILVDAKTPMDNYLAAAASTEPAQIEQLMAAHAQAVASHIDKLSRKAYAGSVNESIDFVVMFLPSESLLESALTYRPDLLDYAFSRNVVPATPTTLFALLRGVGMSWKNSEMIDQAQVIAQLSRELYTRVDVVLGHFGKLGKALGTAVSSYNSTVRSIETRVRPTGQKLAELGVRTDKNENALTETPQLEVFVAELPLHLDSEEQYVVDRRLDAVNE